MRPGLCAGGADPLSSAAWVIVMPTLNADIAAALDEIADLLEVQDANAFRIRAYRNAARYIGELGRSVRAMLEEGEDLDELPGIGADLAGKIGEIAKTGTCAQLDELRSQVPPAITELLRLPGIGPRRVQALRRQLSIESLQQLHDAAAQGLIAGLAGFGARTQQQILDATALHLNPDRRVRLSAASQVADALLGGLRSVHGVREAVAAGSLRRQRETVGDIDLLVAVSGGSAPVMQQFTAGPDVRSVIAKGTTRASVVLRDGLQVDLRAVSPSSLGAAWLYFTGSKAHNIALRRIAQDQGFKLNEYGLFRDRKRIAGVNEEDVYRALGLPWIAPELREDRGEFDAARAGRLPRLVQRSDLRGDLHAHTSASDGRDSLEEMAGAARGAGLEYLAITDHSKQLAVAHGLDASRLAKQIDEIDAINASGQGVTLLKGIEVDILEDGKLALPDAMLRRLDLVVGAVHDRFDLPRAKQTDRVLRAMDHPCFTILAHPTGRLIDEQPACDIDLQRVIRHARERGCFLELNTQPARLDLDDLACRMAKSEGVLVSIASDAHSAPEFAHLVSGIGQARRGWLEAKDVLNTRPLAQLRPLLDGAMGRPARAKARPVRQGKASAVAH